MKTLILFLSIVCFCSFQQPDEPQFRGGKKAMDRFIAENLIYPVYSKQNCIQGTIMISFRLDKQGIVSEAHVSSGMDIDLDDEALRIIGLTSGRWDIPPSFYTSTNISIPISFRISDKTCALLSKEHIEKAVNRYKEEQEITRTITNFYSKKTNTTNAINEAAILELKKKLGYDDAYFDELILQAKNKYKQGDLVGACKDLNMVKNLGSRKADDLLQSYCK